MYIMCIMSKKITRATSHLVTWLNGNAHMIITDSHAHMIISHLVTWLNGNDHMMITDSHDHIYDKYRLMYL